jgi:hypothetical protein
MRRSPLPARELLLAAAALLGLAGVVSRFA